MGSPGACPNCLQPMERRGGKDWCPVCCYIQPCCDPDLTD